MEKVAVQLPRARTFVSTHLFHTKKGVGHHSSDIFETWRPNFRKKLCVTSCNGDEGLSSSDWGID